MSLPSATTRIKDESSGGLATGTDLCAVWSPCADNADGLPRLYSSVQDAYDTHGYCPGLDYGALHVQETGKPFLFLPLAIVTPGTVGRFNTAGNTGTSVCSVAVGGDGALDETDGIVKVANTSTVTVGTDQVVLLISCDGGRNYKTVKLGTATTYTIPYFGLVLSFTVGTLKAGETVLTWHSVAPLSDSTAIAAAKVLLVEQSKLTRRWLYTDEISATAGNLTAIKSAVDTYETANERYNLVKCCLRDRQPQASMSQILNRMTGSPAITFAEVGATGDTITRASGSFVSDGFTTGDTIVVAGSSGGTNDVTCVPATVAALVLTLDTDDLVNEGPVAGITIYATPTLTFGDNGASPDTISRNRGSWLEDGFRVGDSVTISGTASNDGTYTITVLTGTVLTVVTASFAAEVIGSYGVTITAGETASAAVAALDAAMSSVVDKRVDLGYGRGAMLSPITGYALRRNVNWADNILAYKRDIRTTTWWVELGPIASRLGCGFDLNDADGNPYEYDGRVTGGADEAGFTYARTFGSDGAYIGKSQTRAGSSSILSLTHNADIANLVQTICTAATVKFLGQTLVLQPADELGRRYATMASLKELESKVNAELSNEILSNKGGEGPRASSCRWSAATDDNLGAVGAKLHGNCPTEMNGTINDVETSVAVR